MKYKGIIFDLDGTLLNTLEDLCDSVNLALRDFNMPSHSIEEIQGFIGNGVNVLISKAVPKGTNKALENNVLLAFKNNYNHSYTNKTKPYEGIIDTLIKIKEYGLKIGILSNKIDSATKSLSKYYFGDLIDIAMGDLEGIPRKPNPFNAFVMLNNMGLNRSEVLYVGDSSVDFRLCENVGMDCVLVKWGYFNEFDLNTPLNVPFIENPREILDYLRGDTI